MRAIGVLATVCVLVLSVGVPTVRAYERKKVPFQNDLGIQKKYGFIDMAYVFDHYKKTQDFDAKLKALAEKKEKERKAYSDSILRLEPDGMDAADLRQKKSELEQFDKKTKEIVREVRDSVIEVLFSDVYRVINDLGVKGAFSKITDIKEKRKGEDLTAAVLSALNENYSETHKSEILPRSISDQLAGSDFLKKYGFEQASDPIMPKFGQSKSGFSLTHIPDEARIVSVGGVFLDISTKETAKKNQLLKIFFDLYTRHDTRFLGFLRKPSATGCKIISRYIPNNKLRNEVVQYKGEKYAKGTVLEMTVIPALDEIIVDGGEALVSIVGNVKSGILGAEGHSANYVILKAHVAPMKVSE